MKIEEKLFRVWYYFRLGYSTYLSFVLGMFSFVTTTYYLAINNMPFLSDVFPSVVVYAVFLALILPFIGTIVGWVHMKRTLAFTEQISIGIEANPYTYKIQPGIGTHVAWPNLLLNLDFVEIMLESSGNMTPEQQQRINDLRSKIKHLLEGGSIGVPNDLRLKVNLGGGSQ